jgi:hypothetical protein
MWRNQVITAVFVCIVGPSITKADLILKVDGQNPTGIPLMLSGTGPYQVELNGSTTIGPNDVRVEAIGGALTVISEVNYQYSFQYNTGSTAGFVWLITNTDMTIDGIPVTADTTIYELFIFCNPDAGLTGACGSDLPSLIPPEEEGGEGNSIIEEPSGSMSENTEQTTNDMHNPTENNNILPLTIEEGTESDLMQNEPNWFIVSLHDIVQDSYIIEPGCYENVAKITVISTFSPEDSYLLYRDPVDPCVWIGYTGEFNTSLRYDWCNGQDPTEELYNGVELRLSPVNGKWVFTMCNWLGMVEYFINTNVSFNESWWAYVPNEIIESNPISYPWTMHLWTGGYGGHVIIQPLPYCPEGPEFCWLDFTDYAKLAEVYGQKNMTLENLHEIVSIWLVDQ